MKHSIRITSILLLLFFAAQLIGLYVTAAYAPETVTAYNATNNSYYNTTFYEIPYGLAPPEHVEPSSSVISIAISIIIAVCVLFLLMRLGAEKFLRAWFLLVIILGIALALNAFFKPIPWSYTSLLALLVAAPLAYLKVFKRNIIVHNATELLIYPGIASVFIPLLNIPYVIVLLILISIYDMYAVWHAGFMQKMAKYQIETLRIFSGLFIPYIDSKHRAAFVKARAKGHKGKKVPIHLAILGGGDIVFPIITAGIVLLTWGLLPALMVSIFATLALALLFYFSQKGKFYPAMPFITIGCLIGLGLGYLIH